MRINNNVTALNTHRQYGINNNNVAKSVAKLSSGYRINSAADDAAGLAISEKMRAQIRGLTMASKNSQDGISMVQTAEGALQTTHDILQKMRELAVQSGSDTNETSIDRAALNREFQQLINEINDTADKTRFNDQNLIDGTFAKETTSASSTNAAVSSAWAASTVAAGTYTVTLSSVLTTTGVSGNAATFTTDTLTYVAADPLASPAVEESGVKSVCGITGLDISAYTGPTEKSGASNGAWTLGYNQDTGLFSMTNATTGEVQTAAATAVADSEDMELDFGKAGTVTLTYTDPSGGDRPAINVSDLTSANNIGTITLTGGITETDDVYKLVANVNGETINVEAGMDTLVFSNADISVKLAGSVTFDSTTGAFTVGTESGTAAAGIDMDIDVNKTQGKDFVIQSGANQGDELAINIDRMDAKTLGVGSASIGNRLNASAAITQVNTAINLVSTQRSELGALQNRLEFKIQNLDISAENLTSAESRIRDVDMAKEMTEFTKNNILSQAATAMLAQANALPQGVLQLLG